MVAGFSIHSFVLLNALIKILDQGFKWCENASHKALSPFSLEFVWLLPSEFEQCEEPKLN